MEINGKKFLNLQEAVGWLLANNALPFQSTANYAANTEIAKSTIVNPSPVQIKVGALVLFADSKIGTVSGLTASGFMVGSEYTDIQSALAYISAITVDASGYLICTLSNGTTINAGRIKQISSFSIDASQHLIANYNDGTTTDLGAIFSGNVNIAGNLTADSIIENMSGYGYQKQTADKTWDDIYVGVSKTGNKLTIVVFGSFTQDNTEANNPSLVVLTIPSSVGSKLYPYTIDGYTKLNQGQVVCATTLNAGVNVFYDWTKSSNTVIYLTLRNINTLLNNGDKYFFRIETTFLLSENLA